MENSVRDLWSIMHFRAARLSRQRARTSANAMNFPLSAAPATPPPTSREANASPAASARCCYAVRKQDVATELPDRIEQTAFCDLTPAQAEVYRGLLEQSRLKLDNARREKNKGAGRMLVLTALLRLRQACCDLRLLGELGMLEKFGMRNAECGMADAEETEDARPANSGSASSPDSAFRIPHSAFSAKLDPARRTHRQRSATAATASSSSASSSPC